MTEAEWTAANDPKPMLAFLLKTGPATARKSRLFACACCRRIWDRLPDPCNRELVVAVEDHLDGSFDDPILHEAIVASSRREYDFRDQPAYWAAKYLGRGYYKFTAAESAFVVAQRVQEAWGESSHPPAGVAGLADLARDVFGNPFRPPSAVDDTVLRWNGSIVPKLAGAAYDDRLLPSGHLDPARLGVLADALEDAGCRPDAEILRHLRSEGPHVRGCFAIDLLLEKE
jgi:hypothetical protein